MLCAEDELGIGESHDGIMILDPAAVRELCTKDYLHLATDTVIEIGLTANRVDAASHIGVARDLYAYLKHNNIPCELCIPDVSAFTEPVSEEGSIPVEVVAKTDAPGISARRCVVQKWARRRSGFRKNSSPSDSARLTTLWMSAISYSWNSMGNPLHTFDADKIYGGKVIVRDAEAGEKLVTLDGVERELNPADLVIADEREPCASRVCSAVRIQEFRRRRRTYSSKLHTSIR